MYMWNDKEFVREQGFRKPESLINIGSELEKDKQFIIDLIIGNHNIYKHLNESLRRDREIVLEVAKKNSWILLYVEQDLLEDEEIMYTVLVENPNIVQSLDFKLKKDKFFLKKVLIETPSIMRYLNKEENEDKDLVWAVMNSKKNGFAYVRGKYKADLEVIEFAQKNKEKVLNLISHNFFEKGNYVDILKVLKNAYEQKDYLNISTLNSILTNSEIKKIYCDFYGDNIPQSHCSFDDEKNIEAQRDIIAIISKKNIECEIRESTTIKKNKLSKF